MKDLETILTAFKEGREDLDGTVKAVEGIYTEDLGHTTLDTDRQRRTGRAEVVYCAGKTTEQIRKILSSMEERRIDILATRMGGETFASIGEDFPSGKYYPSSGVFTLQFSTHSEEKKGNIAVVSAGTSDDSVAEEAALTAEFYGNRVTRINDVGVAGIHRLFRRLEEIREARVVIVVAGMEGALASVLSGLVKVPVIAVPTSVGYGANFGGLSALLGMLTSCAAGVAAVNIDNGFGAGFLASQINGL